MCIQLWDCFVFQEMFACLTVLKHLTSMENFIVQLDTFFTMSWTWAYGNQGLEWSGLNKNIYQRLMCLTACSLVGNTILKEYGTFGKYVTGERLWEIFILAPLSIYPLNNISCWKWHLETSCFSYLPLSFLIIMDFPL